LSASTPTAGREAVRLTKAAKKAGADSALLVAPYYNKPTQQGFYEHYKAIAESVELPLVVYNIPGRTGKNIEPDTIVRLAELKNIVSLTLPLMAIGGSGVISVVGNIVPKDVMAMLTAVEKGDLKAAREWHYKLFPLCRDLLGLATNPIPIKAAMQLLGKDTGDLRLPMTPLDDAQMASLKRVLANYGLL
jgi:4-hydroxy-tetrahydrodipicolinate synthase